MEGSGGGGGGGEAHSRRGFLRALMRDTVKGATEVTKVMGPPGLRPLLAAALPSEAPPEIVEATPPAIGEGLEQARAAIRGIGVEEMLLWAIELDLEPYIPALRRLAVPSVRLTPGTFDEGAWLGGEPELPDDIDWPHWGGGLLDLIAQVDLAETPIGGHGHLLLFFDTLRAPSGLSPGAEEAARAIVVLAAAPTGPNGGEPMRITRALMLPRLWAASVQALGMNVEEGDRYRELRAKLAEEQGIELEDGPGREVAYHRILGLPNDVTGRMPLICELVSRDLEADDHDAVTPEIEAAATRWILLAQISGTAAGRLFFWIPREDLDKGDFSTIRVVPDAG
jgi:hypothetical protein